MEVSGSLKNILVGDETPGIDRLLIGGNRREQPYARVNRTAEVSRRTGANDRSDLPFASGCKWRQCSDLHPRPASEVVGGRLAAVLNGYAEGDRLVGVLLNEPTINCDVSSQLDTTIADHDEDRPNQRDYLKGRRYAGNSGYSVAKTPSSEQTLLAL